MIKKQNILQHKRNKFIKFDKDAHSYTYNGGELFGGVTTWISNYKEPFNRMSVAKGFAYKHGRSVEAVLAEWDVDREYGNYIHDAVEDLINDGVWTESIELKKVMSLLEYHKLTPIFSEWVIYDEEIRRASAIDIVCVNENDELVVVDLKTMKKGIDFKSKKKMFYPINSLEAHKHNVYSLQVSTYVHWLKKHYSEFKIAETHYILHVRYNTAELIPALNLEKELLQLYEFEKV